MDPIEQNGEIAWFVNTARSVGFYKCRKFLGHWFNSNLWATYFFLHVVYIVAQILKVLSDIKFRRILLVILCNKTQHSSFFFYEATGQSYTQHLQWEGGNIFRFPSRDQQF